jgi:Mg-chelatase subunit ChlD
MTLSDPIWLILLLPVSILFMYRVLPGRILIGLRILMILFIILSLCGLKLQLPSKSGVVVAVIDRSMSMPQDTVERAKETVDLLQNARTKDQMLGVVSFGRNAVVEQLPQAGNFAGFTANIQGDGSDINSALEKALSIIPVDNPGRILLLSDGQYTGTSPIPTAARAAGRKIAIDYRPSSRLHASDLAVSEISVPNTVREGEAFTMIAWVNVPVPGPVKYELIRGGKIITHGEKTMSAGLNRLIFRDRALEAGTQSYLMKVTGTFTDPVPENNKAKIIVGVEGAKRILLVSNDKAGGFESLLKRNHLRIDTVKPFDFPWTLDSLSGYSAVILENVTAESIGTAGMTTLAQWVRRTGAGLMMTGGKNAYAAGGYFKSPLEPIMPVSMELRQEHRKLSLGIVVAMDRSGSMAVPTGDGRTKMDLADLSAVQVLDLLSPVDWFGLLAVDSSSHEIVPMNTVENNRWMRDDILRIDSMGGGIFIYEALSQAASMLLSCPAKTRHIILFADAADSEEPGRYKELLAHCAAEGITVTVIGLGTERDQDAELLKDIAHRGGGRIFFTDNPYDLPRLFAQDTFIVARNTFINENTEIKLTPGLRAISSGQYSTPPKLGGYNLCYLRPGANLSAVTLDKYKAPVAASWQAGIGRVLCYTGEADGKFTGPIGQWSSFGDWLLSMVLWTVGEESAESAEANPIVITQKLTGNINRVELHLDPERNRLYDPDGPVRMTVLREGATCPAEADTQTLEWISPDLLAADIPIAGDETILATIHLDKERNRSLCPQCLPYCPEYKPTDTDTGLNILEKIAAVSGGVERVKPADIWNEVPAKLRYYDMSPWLILAAMVVFLLEILERRTAILSSLPGIFIHKPVLWKFRKISTASEKINLDENKPVSKTIKSTKTIPSVKTANISTEMEANKKESSESKPESTNSSNTIWSEAKARARNRTSR